MNETQLRQAFIQFLIDEKGFPTSSILVEAPIIQHRDFGKLRADLLLLDTRIGEYIAIIEFKNQLLPNTKNAAKSQLLNYLKYLKAPSLPAYLVTPTEGDAKFNILLVSEDEDWVNIDKNQFPEFETLSAKKFIEEKEVAKEEEEKKFVEKERKKKTSYFQALSVSITIIAGILTTILTFSSNKGNNPTDEICECEEFVSRLSKIELKISSIEKGKGTFHSDTTYVIDSTNTYNGISQRIEIIENGISQNPEKVLNILELKQEIAILKEKIDQVKELEIVRNDGIYARIEWLNALVSGIIIAIFGASIAFLLTSYYGKIKNTDNMR